MISRLALAAMFAALAGTSCGGPAPAQDPSTKAAAHVEPRASWYGAVVDESTDLVVALSPTRLMRDPSYGPIFQRASRLAAAKSPGTQIHGTTLEALEQSDAIVVGVKDGTDLDAVIIVAGVPSGFDAMRLVDGEGHALWKPSHEPSIAGVIEMERASPVATSIATEAPAAFFVLPGRTWILATGPARERVRDALVRSAPAAPFVAERHELVTVALGRDVLDRVRRRVGPGLAPIAAGLLRVEATFGDGEQGQVGAVFFYDDARRATSAAERGEDVIRLLADKLSPHLEFLRAGSLTKADRTVRLTARLPAGLLRRFAEVGDLPASP
jgi:hypothetical protein